MMQYKVIAIIEECNHLIDFFYADNPLKAKQKMMNKYNIPECDIKNIQEVN